MTLTRDRRLQMIPLDRLLDRALGPRHPERRLARLLFEHNDELERETSDHLQAALAASQLPRALEQSMERLDARQGLPLTDDRDLEIDAVSLDILIYNQRLFVATTRGLYHVDIDFALQPAQAVARPTKRLEATCLAVSARFGTIAASAEEEGLFVALDEFRWLGNGHDASLRQVAGRSRRTSWASFGLYNYPVNWTPEPILGKLRPAENRGVEKERHVLSDITGPWSGDLVTTSLSSIGVSRESVRYVWSTLDRLFVQTDDGAIRTIKVAREGETALRTRSPFALPSISGRVLSATSSGGFSVVETDYTVWVVGDGDRQTIVNDEAVSVRTYPTSRWFKNVVTAILEDRILLTSVIRHVPALDTSSPPGAEGRHVA